MAIFTALKQNVRNEIPGTGSLYSEPKEIIKLFFTFVVQTVQIDAVKKCQFITDH